MTDNWFLEPGRASKKDLHSISEQTKQHYNHEILYKFWKHGPERVTSWDKVLCFGAPYQTTISGSKIGPLIEKL